MVPPPIRRLGPLAATAVTGIVAGCGLLGGTPGPRASLASGVTRWEDGPNARHALTEVAVAAHDDRIWVAGGMDASGAGVTTVQILDPATAEWSDGPPLPAPVHHAALVSDGTSLWSIGGYTSSGPTDAVLVLAAGAGAWSPAASLPEPRAAGVAAWDGGRLVYVGGVGPLGVSAAVFVGSGDAWSTFGRLSLAREHLAAATDGAGSVYVMGGRRGGLESNQAAVDVVDATGVRRLGDVPTPRGGVAAFWWPSLGACVAGGESPGGTNSQVECIAPDGRVAVLPDLRHPRHGVGAAVNGGRAWILLGGDQPGLFVSPTVECLALPVP